MYAPLQLQMQTLRVGDRISKLQKEDFGFLNVVSLTQNSVPLKYAVVGTVLEVQLNTPIKSGNRPCLK